MTRSFKICATSGLLIVLLAFVVYKLGSREQPLLTIVRSSIWGPAKVYVITSKHLSITEAPSDRWLTRVKKFLWSPKQIERPCSTLLLQSITNAAVAKLKTSYEESADDFTRLQFKFNLAGKTNVIEVYHSYVPELFVIMDECNKVLPVNEQFTEKQILIAEDEAVEALIQSWTLHPDTNRMEIRDRVIESLKQRKYNIQ
ncbi:MAG: hypothetical protein JWM68_658 [Verrucomicrobiales bacterium]|nr:hypothetical protein [Verrucomicrobiales bacterium]